LVTIQDPFGNIFFIPDNLFRKQLNFLNQEAIYDDFESVVKKPTLFIEKKEDPKSMHYLRALGWGITFLMSVQPFERGFIAYECVSNPTSAAIIKIMINSSEFIFYEGLKNMRPSIID
jgi:hypothetical protein